MTFIGISRTFSLLGENQYNTIGAFWDEMSDIYGLENLEGLGYGWKGDTMEYAIGLKGGRIKDANLEITLPDSGWTQVHGRTDDLKEMYDDIYKDGPLSLEIEEFCENGDCTIKFIRASRN